MTTHHFTDGNPRLSASGTYRAHARLTDRDADGCGYTAPFRYRRRVIAPDSTGS